MSQPNDKHIREAAEKIETMKGELRKAQRERDTHEYEEIRLGGVVMDLTERILATERTKKILEEAQP